MNESHTLALPAGTLQSGGGAAGPIRIGAPPLASKLQPPLSCPHDIQYTSSSPAHHAWQLFLQVPPHSTVCSARSSRWWEAMHSHSQPTAASVFPPVFSCACVPLSSVVSVVSQCVLVLVCDCGTVVLMCVRACCGLMLQAHLVSLVRPGRVVNAPVQIIDAPRWATRGLMVRVDTATTRVDTATTQACRPRITAIV